MSDLGEVKAGKALNATGPGERIPYLRTANVLDGRIVLDDVLEMPFTAEDFARYELRPGDVLLNEGQSLPLVGRCAMYRGEYRGRCAIQNQLLRFRARPSVSPEFSTHVFRYCQHSGIFARIATQTTSAAHLGVERFKALSLPWPKSLPEQRAIAEALGDVDALIDSLDRLIAKKRDLKQGAMQQLLTGKTRLPGFSGKWVVRTLRETVDCFDNLRVPLNEEQRARMPGDFPYCGANGVLDYLNAYLIDDDIILVAEDGGYFDEFRTRPIAYRMRGKCWVNNHAHILKAKVGVDQGFVFYSLVHKDILRFLASGTRAKLNKSEMYKIEIALPDGVSEQAAIATVLSDLDDEINALEARRDKTRLFKQGMMQELLTGKTRLV